MDQWLILIGASECQAGFRERAKSVPSNWIYGCPAGYWWNIKQCGQQSSRSGAPQGGSIFYKMCQGRECREQKTARCECAYTSASVDVFLLSLSIIATSNFPVLEISSMNLPNNPIKTATWRQAAGRIRLLTQSLLAALGVFLQWDYIDI